MVIPASFVDILMGRIMCSFVKFIKLPTCLIERKSPFAAAAGDHRSTKIRPHFLLNPDSVVFVSAYRVLLPIFFGDLKREAGWSLRWCLRGTFV